MANRDGTGWSGCRWGSALRVIAVAAGLPLFSAAAASAATFVVNSTLDVVDAVPGNGICATTAGDCTLRAAIQEANASLGFDEVRVSVSGIIKLTLTGAGENAAATGDLDITETIEVRGDGPNSTIIDGNNTDRVFHILPGTGTVYFNDLAIRKGSVVATGDGGGILDESVSNNLNLTNMTLEKCAAVNGGGIYTDRPSTYLQYVHIRKNNADDDGGGVYASAAVSVYASVIEKNRAGKDGSGSGGGICADEVVVGTSIIRSNRAENDGGGVYSGETTLSSTLVEKNKTAGFGGGLYGSQGFDVSNVIIAKNKADEGGGVWCDCLSGTRRLEKSLVVSNKSVGFSGGGISVGNTGELTLEDVTVTKNTTNGSGGGVANFGTLTLKNVSLVKNGALASGTAIHNVGVATTLTNTLVVGSGSANGISTCSFIVVSPTASLEYGGNMSCVLNLSGVNPQLGKLVPYLVGVIDVGDVGLNPPAYPLLAGSPAIDGGDNGTCTSDDQRYNFRPRDGDGDGTATCDIGAYEVQ